MRPVIQEIPASAVALLADGLAHESGFVQFASGGPVLPHARYTILAARPFLRFSSVGSQCTVFTGESSTVSYGNPWRMLDAWMERLEVVHEIDLPLPAGGCFGYWGFGLGHSTETTIPRERFSEPEWPDCAVGFYDSVVVLDRVLNRAFVVATGLLPDGSRSRQRMDESIAWWQERIEKLDLESGTSNYPSVSFQLKHYLPGTEYVRMVEAAQALIRQGDIYQVNLAQRIDAVTEASPYAVYQALRTASPAPFSAYLNFGEWQVASASPELFLRIDGSRVETRPIKGTRPRSADPTRDAQLAWELQTSEKERAELLMITDLLRNDLGKVCEYGSITVPDLFHLERFAEVQHLVSTIEGQLRPGLTHLQTLEACFPGGSISGAPKIRACQIIHELEPVPRGPYTGCMGWVGFNRESQFNIVIRTALIQGRQVAYHAGAGIVADSSPVQEYAETLHKARAFLGLCGVTPESILADEFRTDSARFLPFLASKPGAI